MMRTLHSLQLYSVLHFWYRLYPLESCRGCRTAA